MPCVVLPVEGNTRALQQKWTRATKQRFQDSSHAFSMSCAFLSFFLIFPIWKILSLLIPHCNGVNISFSCSDFSAEGNQRGWMAGREGDVQAETPQDSEVLCLL